jgi:hypothetical protein
MRERAAARDYKTHQARRAVLLRIRARAQLRALVLRWVLRVTQHDHLRGGSGWVRAVGRLAVSHSWRAAIVSAECAVCIIGEKSAEAMREVGGGALGQKFMLESV